MFLQYKNFVTRLISSIILLPIVIYLIIFGGVYFYSFLSLLAILMAFEWQYIVSHKKTNISTLKIDLIGAFFIMLPIASLSAIRALDNGIELLIELCITIAGADIGGYIFGKTLKGPKLAPNISPNKTWSGFLGGIFLAVLMIFLYKEYQSEPFELLTQTIILAIISQFSDLLESKFKRMFGVKDSGNLIPGHGGILDRIDGFILSAPAFYLMLCIINWLA